MNTVINLAELSFKLASGQKLIVFRPSHLNRCIPLCRGSKWMPISRGSYVYHLQLPWLTVDCIQLWFDLVVKMQILGNFEPSQLGSLLLEIPTITRVVILLFRTITLCQILIVVDWWYVSCAKSQFMSLSIILNTVYYEYSLIFEWLWSVTFNICVTAVGWAKLH